MAGRGRKKGCVSTPETLSLRRELKGLGVDARGCVRQGRKTLDIMIKGARLIIEVDGQHHLFNSGQLRMDIRRSNASEAQGFDTIRVPNDMVKKDARGLAKSISKVVTSRKRKIGKKRS